MENKIRAHDGIAGAVYMLSVILGAAVSTQWLWIAGIVAGLQIISPVTQFPCLLWAQQDDARH